MIVTDKFVFIHVHKTGGQSLNDALRQSIPNHRFAGYHLPRHLIPEEAQGLPVVGLVRNPWDWYVSWYAFNRRPGIRNPLFNVVSNNGEGNFISTVTNLVNLGSDGPVSRLYREDLIKLLPDTLDGNRGVGLTKDDIRGFQDERIGYFSWLVERMLGDLDDAQTYIGHFERFEEDLTDILQGLGVNEVDRIQATIAQQPRKNVSNHSHYSHYYDDTLRALIGEKDNGIVDRFEYRFEPLKVGKTCYEHASDTESGAAAGFRKLLGREKFFLQLGTGFDVTALQRKIEDVSDEVWLESGREKLFAVHKDTQSAQLVHFEDYKHEVPETFPLHADFETVVEPIVDYIRRYYNDNGFVVRMLLAKLRAGGKIPAHTDAGYSLLNCHRVHIPVITSDSVDFTVGDETITMSTGEAWEINNGEQHHVHNRGHEDRVHLIIDWMPNPTAQPVAEVLVGQDTTGETRDAERDEALQSMLQRGYQLFQAGQFTQAESQFRQVLHAHPDHVIANNLLGLLYLKLKRFSEAATLIQTALAADPNDAQAHSNLALALKDLHRPDEAVAHFREAARLAPDDPRVFNNLGGTYVEMNRLQDAVDCFERATMIQPTLPEAHYNLGNALLGLERYEAAVASLQQCIALRPEFEEGQKKLDQAIRALQNQPDQPGGAH